MTRLLTRGGVSFSPNKKSSFTEKSLNPVQLFILSCLSKCLSRTNPYDLSFFMLWKLQVKSDVSKLLGRDSEGCFFFLIGGEMQPFSFP